MAVFIQIIALCLLPVASGNENKSPGIVVEVNHANHLSLRITLRSGSEKPAKFTRDKLPWASGHRMSVVMVVESQCLQRELPVSDSMFDEIIMEPNSELTGEINLEAMFPDITRVLKDREVQLFWAYESPEELKIPHWSGGWILIPQGK